ncbi:neuronal acetylcholine receptor subunit alpha-3 [Manduca sexta]|uniref:neuronal acetylcholine receptor subunit alpha-3 n=1 Tax=Manduca sexta TaxID=7130 RepID=UPI00188E6029|nr:neuronal acetylcholine receptor subunit alpha-3 [Manduca sexta]
MRWIIVLVVRFVFINGIKSNNSYTYDMALHCKEHICQHGYNYEVFYRIGDEELKRVKSDKQVGLEMHIAIQAVSNGLILLSEAPNPRPNEDVYEIVVGGGGNEFTELRRNIARNAKASMRTPGILSSIDIRGFYIRIDPDGLIEFGKEGEVLPLISYMDVNPLAIKYFSFAAWNGVEAKFLYDCPAPGKNTTETPPNSQPEEHKLSNSDTLKRNLLMSKLPSVQPNPSEPVNIGVKITNVQYDAFESKLTTRMAVVTLWYDHSMAWNPIKYNGTTTIKFRQGQIWRPTFYVLNSNDIGVFDTRNPDLISMAHNGQATFHFQTKVETLCTETPTTMNKWPHDEYICSIIIEPWQIHEKMIIDVLKPEDPRLKLFADIDTVIYNEWDFKTQQMIIPPSLWNQEYRNDDNRTHQSDRLLISLNLKRRATSHNIVFYTPLLVLTMFVLMSFWGESLTLSRVWFYASCTVFICIGLCYIDNLVPTHSVPSILVLYTAVLAGVLLALLTQVALMSSLTEKLCETYTMKRILTSMPLRAVFCLPPLKISLSGQYIEQENEESGVFVTPRDSNVQEMETENITYGDKKELAEVIDKLMFFVFSLVFSGMLAAHY